MREASGRSGLRGGRTSCKHIRVRESPKVGKIVKSGDLGSNLEQMQHRGEVQWPGESVKHLYICIYYSITSIPYNLQSKCSVVQTRHSGLTSNSPEPEYQMRPWLAVVRPSGRQLCFYPTTRRSPGGQGSVHHSSCYLLSSLRPCGPRGGGTNETAWGFEVFHRAD